MEDAEYDGYIERMRVEEYPMLKGATYLDHAGTTLYSKRLMDRFHADMLANLYGNPHSMSPSSQQSTQMIDSVRLQLLDYLEADPKYFDVIFTANATAAMKLVGDAFQGNSKGFWFGYHKDAHTSLVGIRELATRHHCFASDSEVEEWLDGDTIGLDLETSHEGLPELFAYPAQSNMDGRRLPLSWLLAAQEKDNVYTLLDAAAYLSTGTLNMSNARQAPDFTVLSLYKMFGFPDLGALVVRKGVEHIFQHRRYFGGGTVDMVVSVGEQWHSKKFKSFASSLEDGTLPVHSILALRSAIKVHRELFRSTNHISRHTSLLADLLRQGLFALQHGNGQTAAEIYTAQDGSAHVASYGPIIAFNLRDASGEYVSLTEVDKLAAVRNIHLRTGALCNPGGIATALNLSAWEMRENFSAGHRCGSENDIVRRKPTGVIRVSLGPMSTTKDVSIFLEFVSEFFLDANPPRQDSPMEFVATKSCAPRYFVKSLTVYPMKSCAGWQIPTATPWGVRPEGLEWDREWCLLHRGTRKALSQKQYPKMALIRPVLDLKSGVLRVSIVGSTALATKEIAVPLSADPRPFEIEESTYPLRADVCGEEADVRIYKSPEIAAFFSDFLGVSCQLARFPLRSYSTTCARQAKFAPESSAGHATPRPLLGSNESPILTINEASLRQLNKSIKAKSGQTASASTFRANIVVADTLLSSQANERAYDEDRWRYMQIGTERYEVLGGCRRCQMVCVDQETALKNPDPFVSLAQTRRINGKVLFGVHTCHVPSFGTGSERYATIEVGDEVTVFT